jgi:hypothetical protein
LKGYEYDIDLVKNPKLDIVPVWSVPYAIRAAVKRELDTMTEMKVIRPIQEKKKEMYSANHAHTIDALTTIYSLPLCLLNRLLKRSFII